MRKNGAISLISIGVIFLFLVAVSLCAGGEISLSANEIFRGILRDENFPLATTILWDIRFPRVLIALLTGAALAASGVVMQAYFRNGLASPGLLGVGSGATAGAVTLIGLGIAVKSLWAMPLAAIFGAFVATGFVVVLARNGTGTERLLLAGIALNAMLGAVSSFILASATETFERSGQILFWMMGGLEDRTWEHVLMALPILLALALLAPLGRQMDLLSLGADEAQSLGVNVKNLQRKLIILSTILAALATAVIGTVGFVGLVVPHILRLLAGAEHRRLLPLSIVGGAIFMLACDLLGQQLGALRIGIITAFIGGPFFLWLLRRQ